MPYEPLRCILVTMHHIRRPPNANIIRWLGDKLRNTGSGYPTKDLYRCWWKNARGAYASTERFKTSTRGRIFRVE
ncbi:hypothetical protein TNCV_3635751 [Trichonephila clavipes]|nr:hypothetical protein TNCV_3635751 [Trichonephila clavipes]